MALSDPHLLVFISLCSPLPWNVGGASKLFPTRKIWQKWWDVTFMVRWQMIMTSVLLTDSVDISVWMFWSSKWPCGRSWERSQPTASREQNASDDHRMSLQPGSSPAEHSDETETPDCQHLNYSLMKIPEAEILGSWPTETGSHTLKCVLS